jgi:RNA polymerase-interacting CarD/CdnL/TRCF family regulator
MTGTELDLSPGTTLIAVNLAINSGVVRVEGTEERDGQEYVVLDARHLTMRIPMANVGNLLRAPVSRQQAERWLSVLRDAETTVDERPWDDRYADYDAALEPGASDQLVEMLRRLYASHYASSTGERRLIWKYENIVLAEIAYVLDLSEEALRDELHTIHSAAGTFSPDAAARPAPESPGSSWKARLMPWRRNADK